MAYGQRSSRVPWGTNLLATVVSRTDSRMVMGTVG